MPQTPHVEKHFTGGRTIRDIVTGMSDSLTVPFAVTAGLSGAVASSHIVVTAGLAEIAAGSLATGLGGHLAAKRDARHYATEQAREEREVVTVPEAEIREVKKILSVDLLAVAWPIRLECVRVPAGEFLMGSFPARDREAAKGELPQHRVYLAEFTIGRVPVTNAQYAAFVRSAKYEAPSYWDQEGIAAGQSDHPVVQISWRDARAFCHWLSEATGRSVRLPTEAEWEKTARGTNGRIYPWGDRRPTAELCNYDMQVGHATPVGGYSKNVSPYGALDLAGNVGEWTSSLYRPYPYRADDGREDPAAEGVRVVRGGSFSLTRWNARCACRLRYPPDRKSGHGGFRVVVSPAHGEMGVASDSKF